jgi:anaerobic ribonucleoside-triphosphate reductase activating protein
MIRIFGRIVASEVDGPGVRAVVHFAGCSLRCPGCFNQDLWAKTGPNVREVSPEALAEEILAVSKHVTISGGEPTDQPQGLIDLLNALRVGGAESVILFTGRTNHRENLELLEILGVDVVIDGPYDAEQPESEYLRGSQNQRILVLSDRIEYAQLKVRAVQILVDGANTIVTGFPARGLLEDLDHEG